MERPDANLIAAVKVLTPAQQDYLRVMLDMLEGAAPAVKRRGRPPGSGTKVNHKDGDPRNNDIFNMELQP
jgi:hypothetical protein